MGLRKGPFRPTSHGPEPPASTLGYDRRFYIFRRPELPLDDFNRLLGGCRVLVLPLEDKEISTGQCVLLQAMALGKAIVATKTSGTADYIEDGVDGILVPPHDPGKLRQAIMELTRDDEAIARLGANAKKSAHEKYLPQQYLAQDSALPSPAEPQPGAG